MTKLIFYYHWTQVRVTSSYVLYVSDYTGIETLNLLPLATLEQRLNDLRTQTSLASALLTHLLQTRESLQQDSETYNRLIAELVGDAQRLKSGKPTRTASLRR